MLTWDGIRRDGWITDPMNHWAAEILPSRKDPDGLGERTVIPTAGIALDGTIYVFYQSVHRWGPPGYWDVNHSGIGHPWAVWGTFRILSRNPEEDARPTERRPPTVARL